MPQMSPLVAPLYRCIYMKATVPAVMQDIFNCNVTIHHRATRSQACSLLYRYTNDGYSNSYSHYVCTIWNHLPANIRTITSYLTFIKLLKIYLLNNIPSY